MDKELLKIVSDDLEHITNEWNMQDISDANLRRSSNVLRRLLIHDGDLFKAARAFGIMEIKISSSDEPTPRSPDIIFHQSGGGQFNGIAIKGVTRYSRALTAEEVKLLYEASKQKTNEPIDLHKFLKQPSIIIGGTEINREEIIKYICNKGGGAHYDNSRKLGDKLEEKYMLLDEHQKSVELASKNAIYFELLSIGQQLVDSQDVKNIIIKLKTV